MSNVKEMSDKFVLEKKAFFRGLPLVIASVIVSIILVILLGIVGLIIGMVLVPVIFIAVLYLVWAPNDVFGTFPEEGYSLIIVRGLGFRKVLLKKEGFGLNNTWDVVPENQSTKKEKEFFGMFFFLWPLERIYVYRQKWTKYTEGEKSIEKEEVLRGALLKSYTYSISLSKAEDASRMPIDIIMAVEMMISNPYKALFSMQNWYGGVSNFIRGEIRDEIQRISYSQMIGANAIPLDRILEQKLMNLIGLIKDQYGVEVLKVKTVQIAPSDKELVDASTRASVAELRLKATKIDAEAEAIKRAAETAGAEMRILSQTIGISEDKLQEEIQRDPIGFEKKYKDIIANARDKVNRQMAINGHQFLDIRTPGDPSGLMALVALAKTLTAREPTKGKSNDPPVVNSSPQKLSKEEQVKKRLEDLGLDEY